MCAETMPGGTVRLVHNTEPQLDSLEAAAAG